MSSLPEAGHEHHERIRAHVDRLPELADMLEARPPAAEFGARFGRELDFITGTLLPHIEVVERTLYPELERLMQNRHSMTPMRREHDQVRELVGSMVAYGERAEAGPLNPADALALRRLIISFYAAVKTHLGEEEEYLRVLQGNLSEDEQEALTAGLEHVLSRA